VLMALERRAQEGGSWHVKASLCQTAMWYERLGADCDPAIARGDDPTAFLIESDSPYGRLTHLGPALQMSLTPPRWEQPSSPLGSHEPVWSGTR